MKSPLWIVNSTLALILIAMIAFIVVSIKKVANRPKVAPLKISARSAATPTEEAKPKDLKLIFEERDLFGTYRPSITPVKVIDTLPAIPQPPMPRPVRPRMRPLVQFLEPLPVKLSGIIASSDDAKSQVTVVNNNTKKTTTYKVGDKIIDAHVIRIFPRKVLVVRSNGQQETLFMYPEDAQAEIKNLKEPSWEDVVQRQGTYTYLCNPTTFASRIISLANLIDLTDMTPATHNGKVTGVMIGKMEQRSIGYALGFQPGDVITKINSVAPTSTENRMKIFNDLAQRSLGSRVQVDFTRRGQQLTNTYTLFNLADATARLDTEGIQALPMPFAQPSLGSPSAPPMMDLPPMGPSPMGPPPGGPQGNGPQNPMQEMQRRDREAMNQFGGMNAQLMPPNR